MTVYTSKKECRPVEAFMWERLEFDYGMVFGGIKKLNLAELQLLEVAVRQQIMDELNNSNNEYIDE
tara:strand:+ start:10485 stop:10682 length:198 start_codon:yes stop_codon:yes gene_type:complete